MQNILNEKKSDVGSPYVFYSINVNYSNRTANTVDLEVEYVSHLQYSSSSLKSGTLTGYITINGQERSVTLKSSSDSWSGTTKHYAKGNYTISAVSTKTSLDTKFRVVRGGGTSGTLNEISCNSISIPAGHTDPTNVSYTIEETNQKLIDIGVANNLIVENLSIKKFTFTYTLHDGAKFKRCRVWNGGSTVYGSDTNPLIVDLKTQPFKSKDNGKIPIMGDVLDTMDGVGASTRQYYDYITYININLIETSTTAKRNGQLSGKVKLNINGTFYNGILGNIDQTNYKPIVKYKFWKVGDTEPTTFDYTIASENISVTNNTFTVNDLEIGSSDETATNHFNPDYAYRVKIYVEDNFTNYTSQEKPIPVGEATWTEYKDRVDFKKITIKGKDITENQILWQGAWFMNASQSAMLSQKVSEQKNGIVLVWQAYSNGSAQSWDYNFCFVPKWQVLTNQGRGVSMWLTADAGHIVASKYIYVYDDKLVGHANNSNGATKRNSGITTTNNYWALTYVLGV